MLKSIVGFTGLCVGGTSFWLLVFDIFALYELIFEGEPVTDFSFIFGHGTDAFFIAYPWIGFLIFFGIAVICVIATIIGWRVVDWSWKPNPPN
jgi:hypothetical protein